MKRFWLAITGLVLLVGVSTETTAETGPVSEAVAFCPYYDWWDDPTSTYWYGTCDGYTCYCRYWPNQHPHVIIIEAYGIAWLLTFAHR